MSDFESLYRYLSSQKAPKRKGGRLAQQKPHGYALPTTACRKGHPWTEENTYVYAATGWRQCRICHKERQKLRRARLKEILRKEDRLRNTDLISSAQREDEAKAGSKARLRKK